MDGEARETEGGGGGVSGMERQADAEAGDAPNQDCQINILPRADFTGANLGVQVQDC